MITDPNTPDDAAADQAHLTRLRAGLVQRADQDGLLDIGYRVIDSAIGPLLIAATASGVVRVAFDLEDHDLVLTDLAARLSPRILESADRTDEIARQLDDYLTGERRRFDLPIDLSLVTGFRREVIAALPGIEFGRTRSYGSLASDLGRPGASRAVGTACANNPVPLVVPCHRVIRADGSQGKYRGGALVKARLLELEQTASGR